MTTKDDKEKAKISRETLGKYFYDLSKTCFASFVVANVIAIFAAENIVTPIILALFSGIATFILARTGYYILKNKEMESLVITFGMIMVASLAFYAWMSTKNGKKWLKEL